MAGKRKALRVRKDEIYIAIDLDDSRGSDMVRQSLEKSKATQKVFADLMGISRGQLNRYITGKKRPTAIAVRAALFTAMMSGVSVYFPRPSHFLK